MRCPVCSAPPAAPPIRGGTSESVSVMFGETTAPPPRPASSSVGTEPRPDRVAARGPAAATSTTPVIMMSERADGEPAAEVGDDAPGERCADRRADARTASSAARPASGDIAEALLQVERRHQEHAR